MLDVPFVVLCSHSLGGSIGGGSAGFVLGWGDGTCGSLPLHILACKFPVWRPCSPTSVSCHCRDSHSNHVLFYIFLGVHLLGAVYLLFSGI